MQAQLQIVKDSTGQEVSVNIPLKRWKKVEKKLEELERLKKKLALMKSIKEGIAEVKQARKEGRKLPTLAEFIDECRNQNG